LDERIEGKVDFDSMGVCHAVRGEMIDANTLASWHSVDPPILDLSGSFAIIDGFHNAAVAINI
jgi:hypothetical protein